MAFLQKALPFQAMGEGSPQAPPPFQSLFPALFLSAPKPVDFGGQEGSLCSGVSEVPQGGPEAPAWLPPAPWSIWNLQLSASAVRGIQSPCRVFPQTGFISRGVCAFPSSRGLTAPERPWVLGQEGLRDGTFQQTSRRGTRAGGNRE